MSTERALDLLKQAGLSGYEAKAYLALLAATEPLNGYEVAKASGVPRSTVYETLAKLMARGAAFEVQGGDNVAYVPLPAETLIDRLRRRTDETINGLESILPALGQGSPARVVQHLSGRGDVVQRAIDVIGSARRTLWLSIWPQEAGELVEPVRQAIDRGVEVFTITYGPVPAMPGRVLLHSYSSAEVVEERLQCRLSIVVADHDQALIGGVVPDAVWGIWSDDRVVGLLAAEHVRHDIALQLTAERLDQAGLGDFWAADPELEALRDASAKAMEVSGAEAGRTGSRR